MASYVGSSYLPNASLTDENFQIWANVAQMKDATYSAKQTELQATVDAFASLDVIRPQDKEYINSKITSVVNQINASAKKDLTLGNTASDLLYSVRATANDPVILNAVENTQKYRNFEAQVQQIREKDKNAYSNINYQYALSKGGLDKYLAGETDSIGQLSYDNYVDVTTTALAKVKQLKDLRGKQVIEVPDPQRPGYMTKKTIEGLTDEEIVRYIPNVLSPEEGKQLHINGWAKYGQDLPSAQSAFTDYKSDVVGNIDDNIARQQAIINSSAATNNQKKDAQQKLESYNRQKEQVNAQFASVDINDAGEIGGLLERNSWVKSVAEMGRSEWSLEYEKDDAYFATRGLELDIMAENRQQEELQLSKEKAYWDIKKTQSELGLDENGNALNPVSVSAIETQLADEINPYTDKVNEFTQVGAEIRGLINEAVTSERTGDDVRSVYNAELKERGYNPDGTIIAGKEAIAKQRSVTTAMKEAYDEANIGSIHPQIARAIVGANTRRSGLSTEVAKINTQGLTEAWNQNPEKYINNLNDLIAAANNDKESDLVSDEASNQIYNVWQEASRFVADNGGWKNLKNNIGKDPKKIQQFAEIQQKLENRPESWAGSASRFISRINPFQRGIESIVEGDNNLKRVATDLSNKKLREITPRGDVSFNTQNVATIAGKSKLASAVVNMIPQTEDTPLFDPDKPITYKLNNLGGIDIIQNVGYGKDKNNTKYKEARVTVGKDDAAYKELIKYVDVSDSTYGLDASRTSLKIKPVKTVQYLDNNQKTVLSRADRNVGEIPENIVRSTLLANPASYLTEKRTKELYNKALAGKVDQNKINTVVDLMTANYTKIKPEIKPFDGTWAITVKTDKGLPIYEGDTGLKRLDNSLTYLLQEYPQVIASDAVLRFMIESPGEVDTLINNLAN